MNKVLVVLTLLIGVGLGKLITNPEFTMPQRGLIVGAVFLYAAILAYCDDFLERWELE